MNSTVSHDKMLVLCMFSDVTAYVCISHSITHQNQYPFLLNVPVPSTSSVVIPVGTM